MHVQLTLKINQNHYFHGKHNHLIHHNYYGKMHVQLTLKINQNHYFHGKHNHLIHHMGWRKDRGGTDCPNNSTPIRSGTEQQLIDLTHNQSTTSAKFARAPQNQSH